MIKALLILSIILLAGCEVKRQRANQELRSKLFFECLEKIPKGPERTKYNDWAEVVDECGDQAYYMSLRWTTE